jgi:hypothetical protein
MALDFPASPTTGQTFSSGGVTWTWDGAKWVATGGRAGKRVLRTFTASGTYTPTAGMVDCIIECVGGGGSGGGGTLGVTNILQTLGGGGSGGYSRKYATAADIGASKPVTIGAGGAASSGLGNTGGDTSVGTLCIAKGGSGGGQTAPFPPGAGGVAGTGDVIAAGAPGQGGCYMPNTQIINVGGGGNSVFGGGAAATYAANTTFAVGLNASNYGGGGGGAVTNNTSAGPNSGAGSAGIVVVTELCVN